MERGFAAGRALRFFICYQLVGISCSCLTITGAVAAVWPSATGVESTASTSTASSCDAFSGVDDLTSDRGRSSHSSFQTLDLGLVHSLPFHLAEK